MRNKLLGFIALCLFFLPYSDAKAALRFTATSDRVTVTRNGTLDNLSPFTMACWVKPTATASGRRIMQKGLNATGGFKFIGIRDTLGNVEIQARRATINTIFFSTNTPVSTLNKWYFVAGTFNSSASANKVGRLYVGAYGSPLAEVTYASTTDGSGAVTAEGGSENLYIGNNGNFNAAFPGDIGWCGEWNRELTLGELRIFKTFFIPLYPMAINIPVGFNGTGTQTDYSGKKNNGTVTGAGYAPGPPFGAIFSRGGR